MKVVLNAIQSTQDELQPLANLTYEIGMQPHSSLTPVHWNAIGLARVKYEKAVRKAEADLIKTRYQHELSSSDKKAKAEVLAKLAFHKPGSLLTTLELKKIQESLKDECPNIASPSCSRFQEVYFRTLNGTCNNLFSPLKGSVGENFHRLMPAHYEDDSSRPHGFLQSTKTGILESTPFECPYPSSREVSRHINRPEAIDDDIRTHFLMQWSQFLSSDVVYTPAFGKGVCQASGCTPNEECYPIQVKKGEDPGFTSLSCLAFGRSIPSCKSKSGRFPVREQFNLATHYIDASMIYGSDDWTSGQLRDLGNEGKLKVGPSATPTGKPSLPFQIRDNAVSITQCPEPLEHCFIGGHQRVNEHIGSIVMQTIWVRQHNSIAEELARLNPRWNDDTIYFTARKIVGGFIQAIVFQEYLVEVLGREIVQRFILNPIEYNPNTFGEIPNSFATAAFRFGHSMIRPDFARLGEKYKPLEIGPINLQDLFFSPNKFNESGGTDSIIRGLASQHARRADEFITSALTGSLYKTGHSFGQDLASLDINRGRDHGLAPYIVWKDHCIDFFRQQGIIVSPTFRNELTLLRLMHVYGSLDTVDLIVGGMAEEPFQFNGTNSILGPTFTYILIKTFRSLVQGDRHFYRFPGVFTPEQMKEITTVRFSKILCENSDNIKMIQPNVFRVPSLRNPRVPCDSLIGINLTKWQIKSCLSRYYFMRIFASSANSIGFAALKDKSVFSVPLDGTSVSLNNKVACPRVECPEEFTRIIALGQLVSCQPPTPADGLPRSISSSSAYDGYVTREFITEKYGFFASKEDCLAGTTNALMFSCGASHRANDDANVGSILIDSNDIVAALNRTNIKQHHDDNVKEDESNVYDSGSTKEEEYDYLKRLEEALDEYF